MFYIRFRVRKERVSNRGIFREKSKLFPKYFLYLSCVLFVVFSFVFLVDFPSANLILLQYYQYTVLYLAIISDFISFYSAGTMLVHGKARVLYDLQAQHATQMKILEPIINSNFHLPFRNTPIVALLFIPFSLFSFVQGYVVYISSLVALYALFLKSIWKILGKGYLMLLFIFFIPIYYSFVYANISTLVLLILYGVYLALKTKKVYRAGVFSGLLFIKPQFLLIIPFLLVWFLKRDKHLFKSYSEGLIFSSLILFLISIILVGFSNIASYPLFLAVSEREIFGSRWFQTVTLNHTFTFISRNWESTFSSINLNVLLYLLPLLYLKLINKKISLERLLAGAIPLVIVSSFHSLTHDLILMPLAFFLLLYEARSKGRSAFSKYILYLSLILLFSLSFAFLHTKSFWIPLIFYITGFGILSVGV